MSIAPFALTNPDPTDPLNSPSHSGQHSQLNTAVAGLNTRLSTVETRQNAAAADVEQARRVSNTWVVSDSLTANWIILPLLWNLTQRPAEYEAAQATVLFAPSGGDIVVDICTGNASDPSEISSDSILTAPLTIPDGQFSSNRVTTFNGSQIQDTFLQVVIWTVGANDPGTGLTVQLNRLL